MYVYFVFAPQSFQAEALGWKSLFLDRRHCYVLRISSSTCTDNITFRTHPLALHPTTSPPATPTSRNSHLKLTAQTQTTTTKPDSKNVASEGILSNTKAATRNREGTRHRATRNKVAIRRRATHHNKATILKASSP